MPLISFLAIAARHAMFPLLRGWPFLRCGPRRLSWRRTPPGRWPSRAPLRPRLCPSRVRASVHPRSLASASSRADHAIGDKPQKEESLSHELASPSRARSGES